MRLSCPECNAYYDIPDDLIPPEGREVECSACGHIWHQLPPYSEAAPMPEASSPPIARGLRSELNAPAKGMENAVNAVSDLGEEPVLRRPLPDDVLSILREETARELHARRAARGEIGAGENDTETPESQADEVPQLGVEPARVGLPPVRPTPALPAPERFSESAGDMVPTASDSVLKAPGSAGSDATDQRNSAEMTPQTRNAELISAESSVVALGADTVGVSVQGVDKPAADGVGNTTPAADMPVAASDDVTKKLDQPLSAEGEQLLPERDGDATAALTVEQDGEDEFIMRTEPVDVQTRPEPPPVPRRRVSRSLPDVEQLAASLQHVEGAPTFPLARTYPTPVPVPPPEEPEPVLPERSHGYRTGMVRAVLIAAVVLVIYAIAASWVSGGNAPAPVVLVVVGIDAARSGLQTVASLLIGRGG
ncbi:MAG: zinc-ribbon domain-containing protein [Paracoccus sp. (in: a-proteobacteria)]